MKKVPFKKPHELRDMKTEETLRVLNAVNIRIGPQDVVIDRISVLLSYLYNMTPPPIPQLIPTDQGSRLQIQDISDMITRYVIDPDLWGMAFGILIDEMEDLGHRQLYFDFEAATLELYQRLVVPIGGTTFNEFLAKWDTPEKPLIDIDLWDMDKIKDFLEGEFPNDVDSGWDILEWVLTRLGRRDGFIQEQEAFGEYIARRRTEGG